ncbi:hypothetical protein, partial [Klebsiella pneumoniae]|uniref:hypothetical protein n=1 Tax=Klebsiella pneumoniae TaxID=573 RepID=UPI0039E59238
DDWNVVEPRTVLESLLQRTHLAEVGQRSAGIAAGRPRPLLQAAQMFRWGAHYQQDGEAKGVNGPDGAAWDQVNALEDERS